MEKPGGFLVWGPSTAVKTLIAVQFDKPVKEREETHGTQGCFIDAYGKLYAITAAHILSGFDGKSLKDVPKYVYQAETGAEGEHLGQNVLCCYNEKEVVVIDVFEINKNLFENIGPYIGLAPTDEDKVSILVFLGQLEDLIGVNVHRVGIATVSTRGTVTWVQGDHIFIAPDESHCTFAKCADSGTAFCRWFDSKLRTLALISSYWDILIDFIPTFVSFSVYSDTLSTDGCLSNLDDLDQSCSSGDFSNDSDIANFTGYETVSQGNLGSFKSSSLNNLGDLSSCCSSGSVAIDSSFESSLNNLSDLDLDCSHDDGTSDSDVIAEEGCDGSVDSDTEETSKGSFRGI